MKKRIESVLGRKISAEEYKRIRNGWNSFATNPEPYRNSVVVELILLTLDEM